MTSLQALVLGVLQGATEFLPLSSSGHLVIAQKLFGLTSPPVFFDILVHLATLLAIVIFFWRTLSSTLRPLLIPIIIASIPTGLIGLLLNPYQSQLFNSLILVSLGLAFTSLLLFLTKKTVAKNTTVIKPLPALVIGLFQGLSIFPGVSRSGSTLAASAFLGIKPHLAFAFSFLLSIPAVLAALLLQFISETVTTPVLASSHLIGFTAALLSGLISLKFLSSFVLNRRLHLFMFYTLPLSFLVFILARLL